jgi:hypothetical protein|tara:strand:- start:1089 stop:1352 length:264 start_codon:yes stop_codon:yes gene_type:complete
MATNKLKIAVLVLVICLVVAVGYIVLGVFQQGQLSVFQSGAQYGYEQAIVQVAQQAVTCQPVPLSVQNQTINLIAVDCLNAAPTPTG